MDLPPLALVLLTYGGSPERREYAYRTLHSALDNIAYAGPLLVHIADDGSPPEHRAVLREIAGGYAHVAGVTASNSERRGYGASWNLASQQAHLADIILPLEDDWDLRRPLDLGPLAAALCAELQCIRLGYIGFTQELRGRLLRSADQMFLLLDPASPERHVFAGHPRLETRGFGQRVGPWPEGHDAGTTEFLVAGRDAARQAVGWPLDLVPPAGGLFAHIGTVQAREDQRAAV